MALDISRRQLELLDQVESPSERAMVLFETGAVLKDLAGRYEEALELAMESYAIAKDRSLHELMHATYLGIYAMYLLGRWDDLVPFLEEHVSAFRNESEASSFAVRGGPLLGALVLMHQGETEKAQELAATVHPKGERATRAEGVRALVALAGSDARACLTIAETALSVAPEWRAPEARWAKLEGLSALRKWDLFRQFLPEARNVARGLAVLGPHATGLRASCSLPRATPRGQPSYSDRHWTDSSRCLSRSRLPRHGRSSLDWRVRRRLGSFSMMPCAATGGWEPHAQRVEAELDTVELG